MKSSTKLKNLINMKFSKFVFTRLIYIEIEISRQIFDFFVGFSVKNFDIFIYSWFLSQNFEICIRIKFSTQNFGFCLSIGFSTQICDFLYKSDFWLKT